MKAGIIFSGTGPILVLTTYESFEDRAFIEKLTDKGIRKFIAYEIPLEQVKAKGLPAVIGEIVYLCEGDYKRDLARGKNVTAEEYTIYNYNPPLAQVREWIQEAGLAIEEEGSGKPEEEYEGKIKWWYAHFIVRKK